MSDENDIKPAAPLAPAAPLKATNANPAVPPEASAAAAALGRRGRGVPKTLTDEERARRAQHAREMTAKRVFRSKGVILPPKKRPQAGPTAPAPKRKVPIYVPSRTVVAAGGADPRIAAGTTVKSRGVVLGPNGKPAKR